MIKYIIFTLLFLLKIGFVFGQNVDSLFRVVSKKHENVPYYTIVKDTVYSNDKEKKMIYSYQFVQRKHKDKVFAFLVFQTGYSSTLSYSIRYYASRNQTDKRFTILDKYKEEWFYWQNIELLDLNNDNIREIAINYENGYPKHNREVYNFSTDSIASVVLKSPYDDGILTCIDTVKNLYFTINRNNLDGLWNSELFVIHKDFSKGNILGTARWDGIMTPHKPKESSNAFTVKPFFEISCKGYTYFYSNSDFTIKQFHPHVDNWNSKENIEFMKNAYRKMLKEFDIEY